MVVSASANPAFDGEWVVYRVGVSSLLGPLQGGYVTVKVDGSPVFSDYTDAGGELVFSRQLFVGSHVVSASLAAFTGVAASSASLTVTVGAVVRWVVLTSELQSACDG